MKQKNIIITGGQLFNKGAESMTFITVNEICNRYPNHNIYLLSEKDFRRPTEEKEKYKFTILPGILSYFIGNGLYAKIKKIDASIVSWTHLS